MKDVNRGKYGGFNTKTPDEKLSKIVEANWNTKNGPVTVTKNLDPDITQWTLRQYFDWLATLTQDELKTHLDLDPNKPSTRETNTIF